MTARSKFVFQTASPVREQSVQNTAECGSYPVMGTNYFLKVKL